MDGSSETSPPRRRWRYGLLVLVVAPLAFGLFRMVNHRFFQMEYIHAQNDLAAIRAVLEDFADAHSKQYPADLKSLVTPDETGKCWLEGYSRDVPRDPWKHEYQYAPPTPDHPRPRVWSFGADGKVGGSGADKDIDSDS